MNGLPIKNVVGRAGRSAALGLLCLIMAAAVFGGGMIATGLHSGLNSLEARLGADVIVVPGSVRSKIDLKKTMIQDVLGEFYMSRSLMNSIAEVDGVQAMTAQTYLVTLTTGCCDVSVQLIGFEPDTDFIVTPWIGESWQGTLGMGDLVVGSALSVSAGDSIKLFDRECTVVAQLNKTGTSMDTGVYATVDTIRMLMEAAAEHKQELLSVGEPDSVVSAVYVKVADGYDPANVAGRINMHVRHVRAEGTRSMLSGVADSLSGMAGTVKALSLAVLALAFIILVISFVMMAGSRRREFALLRVAGASRRMLASLVFREALIISLPCGAFGTALAALVVYPFSNLIGERLQMPFLLPGVGAACLWALGTVAAVAVCCCAASSLAAFLLSRVDTGKILREDN